MRKILLLTAVLTFMLLLTVAIGEEKTMGVGQINVFADAGIKGVSYSSDDPSVARVDAVSGRISALAPGVCTLTGVVDGEIVYTLELTVLKAPSSISVAEKSVQMMQGSYMKPQNAIIAEGEWAGDIEVRTTGEAISMTPDGMIYARVTGSGMVYMRTYNGLSVKYEIKVRDKPAQIVFAETDIHMGLGESRFLSYTLLPQYSYGRVSFELEGDTDAIAFDEGTLQVTGKGIGSLTITAMCESGVSETIRVYVLPLPEHLTETTPIDTAEGLTGTIPKPLPEGTFAFFEYESLTPDVIQVDSSGRWQALKGGTGRVRLHALETELYAEQEFFVLPMPTSVSIDVPSVKMYIGETFRCEATVLPEGALDHLTWKSSNPGCVSVDAEGRLTALTYGSTVISATADNGLSDSVTITVPKLPTYMEMGIKYAELKTGESAELYCTFSKDTYAKVTYASLDEDIAAVDRESGRVTGAGFGTTAIVATSSNGLTAACLVTVTGDSTPREQELEAVFLDVDSNDAILIRVGDEYAFIDSGNHIYGERVRDYLKERGITHLRYYIGTHAHLDHIGGACVLLDSFDIDMVIVPHRGVISEIKDSAWTGSEKEAAKNATYGILAHGQTIYLGGVPFKCIGPITIKSVSHTDNEENSNSLVLRCDIGEVSMLLTGDGTISEFNAIMRAYPDELDVDIFKNTHHAGELTKAQLEAIHPGITVFSITSLHLPSERYQKWLTDMGSEIYMTAERVNGVITLWTDGRDIIVTPQYEDNRANWYNEITGKPRQ